MQLAGGYQTLMKWIVGYLAVSSIAWLGSTSHAFMQEVEDVALPSVHSQKDECVPVGGRLTDRWIDLDAVRFAEPLHLGRQRLRGRDGVVVLSLDEEDRDGRAADGRDEPRTQLRGVLPGSGRAGESDRGAKCAVALGYQEGERGAEGVPGHRNAVRVDLGERAQERQSGQGVG